MWTRKQSKRGRSGQASREPGPSLLGAAVSGYAGWFVSFGSGGGSTAMLRDNAVIQSRVARACGRLESARAFLLQMLREIWAASAGSGALSLEQRARLRIAITGAMEAARK